MFCAGRPSMFGAGPLLEINPSWGTNGYGPWASQPLRGLMHEILGNGVRFQDLWGRNQLNCIDHSGRRHCRTHCYGHRNPEDLLEQFIIENTMNDTHQTSIKDNGHQCKKVYSETNESKTSELGEKQKHIDKYVEVVPQSLANDTVAKQSSPWSISIDMDGCDEVRARSEENKIVVEGQTHSKEGFMTVKRILILPSHVKAETLTATLGKNGKLTLSEPQTDKENKVTDIPLSKENSSTDDSENKNVQSDKQKGHQCEKEGSESNESKTSDFNGKEKDTNKSVEVTESQPNNTVAKQSTPWSVSFNMNGCDEVRARTEENRIVVEGHTRSTEGFMTVKRVMTLPSHVKGEALTATLERNGTLTLTETQRCKENQANNIPLSKENIILISNTEQSENESTQSDFVEIDTKEVNMNDSNLPK